MRRFLGVFFKEKQLLFIIIILLFLYIHINDILLLFSCKIILIRLIHYIICFVMISFSSYIGVKLSLYDCISHNRITHILLADFVL